MSPDLPSSSTPVRSLTDQSRSTTTMAGEQPLQTETSAAAPGAFPETPAPNDDQSFSVGPEPASADKLSENVKPGTSSSTTAGDDLQQKSTQGTVNEESNNTSGSAAPTLPTPLSPQGMAEAQGAPIFFGGVGPQTTNVIPESGLPMGKAGDSSTEDVGPMISSVAPTSTTNELAGQVPKEPSRVPDMVVESQKEAHAAPEASANPDAVLDKTEVEKELKSQVSEAPPTSEPGKLEGGITGMAAGAAAAAATTAGGAALAANQAIKNNTGTDPISYLPQAVQNQLTGPDAKSSIPPTETAQASSQSPATTSDIPADASRATTDTLPAVVLSSQKEAHADPEASGSAAAVTDKGQVEQELMAKVPATEAQGEPAPTATASGSAVAPTTGATSSTATGVVAIEPTPPVTPAAGTTGDRPTTSSTGAPQLSDPTAGVAALSLGDAGADKGGLNATAADPAQTPSTSSATADKVNALAAASARQSGPASGNVSPGTSVPDTKDQTSPKVTTGVDSTAVPTESTGEKKADPATPAAKSTTAGEAESTKTTESGKKEKRRSLFGRIKDKLKN